MGGTSPRQPELQSLRDNGTAGGGGNWAISRNSIMHIAPFDLSLKSLSSFLHGNTLQIVCVYLTLDGLTTCIELKESNSGKTQ